MVGVALFRTGRTAMLSRAAVGVELAKDGYRSGVESCRAWLLGSASERLARARTTLAGPLVASFTVAWPIGLPEGNHARNAAECV